MYKQSIMTSRICTVAALFDRIREGMTKKAWDCATELGTSLSHSWNCKWFTVARGAHGAFEFCYGCHNRVGLASFLRRLVFFSKCGTIKRYT